MGRFALVAASFCLSFAQKEGTSGVFCFRGIPTPPRNLLEDGDESSVDVLLAQAPLFSTKGNRVFGLFGLYHTALVFRQLQRDGSFWHWTLEFDATTTVEDSIVPELVEDAHGHTELRWSSDARFCLTEGEEPLWGLEHWTKAYAPAARLTANQVRRVFTEFVAPFNGTGPGSHPRYQLWRVEPTVADQVVKDVTCADGVAWALHFITTTLGAKPLDGMLNFRSTTMQVPGVFQLQLVNQSDHDMMSDMIAFYKHQRSVLKGNVSTWSKVKDFLLAFPMRYVHDASTGNYFKLSGRISGMDGRVPGFLGFGFKPKFDWKSLLSPPFDRAEGASMAVAEVALV